MSKQKTILITGSSRGMGRATAELAHAQGWQVILHGRTDSDALDELHSQLAGSLKVFFDVSDQNEVWKKLEQVIEQVPSLDAVVNNAGIGLNRIAQLEDIDEEQALQQYKVNVLGPAYVVKACLKALRESKGSVVNIASIRGETTMTNFGTVLYATTKAGLRNLTAGLAKEYKNVRFNTILPGYIETEMAKDWPKETFDRIKNGTLVGRIGKPSEVAAVTMFLASDSASYVSGAEIVVDGGFALGL